MICLSEKEILQLKLSNFQYPTHRNITQLHCDDSVKKESKVKDGIVKVVIKAERHHLAKKFEIAKDEEADEVEHRQAEAVRLPKVLRTQFELTLRGHHP